MVKVKNNNIESRRINREIHSHATSEEPYTSCQRPYHVKENTRHTAQNHECDQMTRPRAQAQLDRGVPSEGYERNTICCHHHAHGHVGYTLGIQLAALELEVAVIARQETSEPNEHLSQRRVNVEIKLAFEVVRPKLAKVGLVPDHQVREPDFMKPRPA